MNYTLQRASGATPRERPRQAIVPPRPGKGERQPRPYSTAELNALWATAHSINWQAMVTLNPPTTSRITVWPALRETLAALKTTLTNWHRRKGFPAMLVVTEFDPDSTEVGVCANFHIGCAAALSVEQQKTFTDWWLSRCALTDNRGRVFQHAARGGGQKLQDYLAKDISHRGGQRRYVKYAAPWLPVKIETRLWFVIGVKRRTAREGAKLWAQRGVRRRKFDSEHAKTQMAGLTASTGTRDSEHASTFITTEGVSHAPTHSQTSQVVFMPHSDPVRNAQFAAVACAGYSPPVSVATLQQFGQSLPSWVALVQRGETVAIMDGGREVARLVPPEAAQTKPAAAPVRWPDFAARRRAVFGEQVLPAGTAAALVNEDRGA